jgi:NAD(P)-dependent dehydrogenase (short-subunit alcohol dehydrogenase family)
MAKVAIITGGASGIGLEVAKSFAIKGWKVHIFDLNEKTGKQAEAEIHNATFTVVDVASYESLASGFDAVFRSEGTVDFVFANAGLYELSDPYATVDRLPPPPPVSTCLDVNLHGVINTSYLAQHYFRASPHGGRGAVLVSTSSIVGLVRVLLIPLNNLLKFHAPED